MVTHLIYTLIVFMVIKMELYFIIMLIAQKKNILLKTYH